MLAHCSSPNRTRSDAFTGTTRQGILLQDPSHERSEETISTIGGVLVILHCLWCPRPKQAGGFFLWAESSAKSGNYKKRIRGKASDYFPYLASPTYLLKFLHSVFPSQLKNTPKTKTLSLLIPTIKEAEPLASSPLICEANSAVQQNKPVKLHPWIVEGFEFAVEDAVPLLISVSDAHATKVSSDQDPGQGVTLLFGADVLFWSKAAKLLLDLLIRQRFIPHLKKDSGQKQRRCYRSAWAPLLIEKDDIERVRFLAESIPPVCRAGFERDTYQLVDSFLSDCTDAMVRKWMSEVKNYSQKLRDNESPGAKWFRSLLSPDHSQVEGDSEKLEDLRGGLELWVSEVYSKTPRLRCCFRLEEPKVKLDDEQTSAPSVKSKTSTWTLNYFLQASDDPSLLLPAGEVWKGKGTEQFDAADMETIMMKDLGKASRLCQKIDESLRQSPAPTHSRLNVEEAYSFLAKDAWLLKESGFGVLVPSWSQGGKGSRLRIQLKVKPSQEQRKKEAPGIFTLQSIVEFDWKVAVGDGSIVLTEEEFRGLVSLKQPLVSVRGQWVELQQEDIKSALEMLRSYKNAGGIPAGAVIELAAAGVTEGSVEVQVTDVDGWLKGVIPQLTSREVQQEQPAPAGFSGVLRPYQTRGFSWLAFMSRLGLGACLADDMGLGKTIQFIALMLHNASVNSTPDRRYKVLLVCPTSIVGNWRREVQKFAPSAKVMIHYGGDRLRGDDFVRAAQAHHLVITSYSLMTRDADALSAVDWNILALDEAQNIKNSWTKQSQAARRLKATLRIALTGTPIENRLSELWSIMDFLNPGYLGSLEEFRKAYAIPIERYGENETQQRLRRIVQPFILRRLKTDPGVADDLPEKFEAKVYCDLTGEQASLYEAYVKEMLAKIEFAEGMERRGLVLAALTRLKQICDHPSLFLADNSSNLQGRSGKMERLREMLDEVISSGEKALIFTQYATMGDMLRQYLQASLGYETLFLHGGVPRKTRDEMVLRFQSGDGADSPSVFILSLKAGGLGLNLTRANHVFHFDRWWNPAVENQATDRAHRIGQTRNVQVHKLISGGTLEDKIDMMIERKKGLAENIIGTGEAGLTELSTEELREIFTLRREESGVR